MVQNQGMDVYLAPFSDISERCEQHAVPLGSPAFTNDPNEVYIEAVDGERFIIVGDPLKDFDMKGAEHLRLNYEIDQSRGSSGRVDCLSLSELNDGTPQGTNLQGRWSRGTTTRKVDGAWSKCGFVFATLETGIGLCFS
jgi:hypothetical protein